MSQKPFGEDISRIIIIHQIIEYFSTSLYSKYYSSFAVEMCGKNIFGIKWFFNRRKYTRKRKKNREKQSTWIENVFFLIRSEFQPSKLNKSVTLYILVDCSAKSFPRIEDLYFHNMMTTMSRWTHASVKLTSVERFKFYPFR